MTKVSGFRGRARTAAPGLCLALVLLSAGSGTAAASASGFANVTILSQMDSLPIVIRFRVTPSGSSPAFTGISSPSARDSAPGARAGTTARLIDMDAAWTASFSVAGSVTSNYTLQTLGTEGAVTLPSAGTGNELARPDGAGTGFIYAVQALPDDDEISVVTSLLLTRAYGELRVTVNYN